MKIGVDQQEIRIRPSGLSSRPEHDTRHYPAHNQEPTIIFGVSNMISAKPKPSATYQEEAGLYRALNHPVRLAILDILRDGEQCVCHIEAILALRQAYISQHLMVLREAGLVEDRRDGWNIFYRVRQPNIYRVMDAMQGVSGGKRQRIAHVHSAADCPCPKCNQ